MTENSQKIIKDEIVKLPMANQDAINSVNWIDIIEEVGKKLLLSEEKINKFQVLTGLILVGLINKNRYSFEIENLGLTNTETQNIIVEIEKKIIEPIAQKMESSIKKKLMSQSPRWDQSVDFIVSGGDYSVFIN